MDGDDEKDLRQTAVTRKSLTTFPFSKTTCVCNCGKYNLKDLPRLHKILPEGYEYKLCEYLPLDREDKFLVTLRMTLSTREEALEWKRRFEEKSLTTHVKDKTFPKVERVSIFKAQYRCQFFDRRKNKKKLPEKSKFRDCHSILFMNIKKYFKNTVDRHMPTYQTVVRLHYAHDHPLDTADVLKKRQLNEDIKCRFLEMFRQGMKPKDALDKHKRELLQNLGPEKYRQVVCDGYYVPNVPKAYRLYYQIYGKGVSAKTTTKRSSRHNPNPDWIAFQNFPDVIAADSVGGCDDDDDGGGSDGSVLDNCEASAVVEGCAEVKAEQHHLGAGISSKEILDQQNSQRNLTSGASIRDTVISQILPATHSLGSRTIVDDVTTHSITPLDGQLLKLADTDMMYSSIPAHNSMYTDMRGQNLLAQTMPLSSFGDAHLGMGLFNLTQPTWENFNMAHQQAVVPNIQQQQHSLGFQNLGHQNASANYMILPNTSCQNPSTHFVPTQGMLDHNTGLQNTVSRTAQMDLNIAGPDCGQQCSWTQIRPHYNVNMSEIHSHPQDMRRDKVLPPTHLSDQSQVVRKSSVKKTVHKKKKPTKELNMKHVTKRWMDKKPKVEAETQNLASEVLQTILLTDEAEKLKVKLLTFLSGLETKMMSNPKLFVPAIRQFLDAGEGVEDDSKLASYLKDFGKTEENIIKTLETKRIESRESCSTQTKLSGPVFKLGKVKSNRCIRITTDMNKKSQSVTVVKHPTLCSRGRRKKKLTVNTDPPVPSNKTLQSSDFTDALGSCKSGLKTGCDLNESNIVGSTKKPNHTDTVPSNCCKQLKKPTRRSFRERKERQKMSVHTQSKRVKCKTQGRVATVEEKFISQDNSSQLHEVSNDIRCASHDLTKKLVVKFTRLKQTV